MPNQSRRIDVRAEELPPLDSDRCKRGQVAEIQDASQFHLELNASSLSDGHWLERDEKVHLGCRGQRMQGAVERLYSRGIPTCAPLVRPRRISVTQDLSPNRADPPTDRAGLQEVQELRREGWAHEGLYVRGRLESVDYLEHLIGSTLGDQIGGSAALQFRVRTEQPKARFVGLVEGSQLIRDPVQLQ